MDQITAFIIKTAVHLSSIVYFSIFLLFVLVYYGLQPNCFGSVSLLSSTLFQAVYSSDEPAVPDLTRTEQLPKLRSSNRVKTVKYLGANEANMSFRNWVNIIL